MHLNLPIWGETTSDWGLLLTNNKPRRLMRQGIETVSCTLVDPDTVLGQELP